MFVLALVLLVIACAPGADSDADQVLTCGDGSGDTPMQECIARNLAVREATVRMALDTLTAAGLVRTDLDEADAREWQRVSPSAVTGVTARDY